MALWSDLWSLTEGDWIQFPELPCEKRCVVITGVSIIVKSVKLNKLNFILTNFKLELTSKVQCQELVKKFVLYCKLRLLVECFNHSIQRNPMQNGHIPTISTVNKSELC